MTRLKIVLGDSSFILGGRSSIPNCIEKEKGDIGPSTLYVRILGFWDRTVYIQQLGKIICHFMWEIFSQNKKDTIFVSEKEVMREILICYKGCGKQASNMSSHEGVISNRVVAPSIVY